MRFFMVFVIIFAAAFCGLATEVVPGKYQLITLALPSRSVILIRCNTQNGEGYYRLGNKWYKGVEAAPLEPSTFMCQAQAYGDNAWILARIDLISGRIWTLQGEVWRIVLESPENMQVAQQQQQQQPSQPSLPSQQQGGSMPQQSGAPSLMPQQQGGQLQQQSGPSTFPQQPEQQSMQMSTQG